MSTEKASSGNIERPQAQTAVTPAPTDPDHEAPEAGQQTRPEWQKYQLELEKQNQQLRQTQAELEASRARYFDLYDLAPVGYVTLNEAGVILEANLTLAGKLGRTRDELVARPLAHFIAPADRDMFDQHRQQLLNTGSPQSCELRLIHAQGHAFWVLIKGIKTQDETGLPTCRATISDISAYKQMEQTLRESENRFRALIENAPDAMNIIGADGRLTYASPSALRILGYTAADTADVNMAELTHPDDLTAVLAILMEIIQEPDKVATTRYRFRHKDGTWRWLESTISNLLNEPGVEGILFNFRDITQHKQAEDAAQRQSEQIRLLYDASRRLNRTLDLDEIYQTVYDFLTAVLPCDTLLISAFDPATERITCRAYWARQGERLDVSNFPPIPLEPEGQGTQSLVIRTGQSLLLNDYLTQRQTSQTVYQVDDETHDILELDEVPPDAEVTRAALIVPLKTGEIVTGVIQVMSYLPDAYTETHLKLLEALALHINAAQTNALLYSQVQNELNERKQVEAALRESYEKFRTVADFTYDWEYWIGPDGRYLYISPACERVTGYTAQEFMADRNLLRSLIHPEDRAKIAHHNLDAITSKEPISLDFRIYTRAGEERWINHACQPVYRSDGTWLGRRASNRDITERKQAEEALRESEAKLRLLFEILPVGVSILNANQQLVYMNPALADILQIDQKGLRQGDYQQRQYIAPNGAPMLPKNFASARALNEQQPIQHVETGVVKEDGQIIWTEVSAVPVSFPDWKVVIVTTNITEHKQAEEALRESHHHLEATLNELRLAQTQLIQQERLAAVGQLAAGIAHDFNNILAIITLYVDISLRSPNISPEIYKTLQTIGHQAERAAHLVQQILDFGRRAILKSRSIDLSSLLKEQVELWQRTIPESITFHLDEVAVGCMVYADPTRMQQMLTNLVLNARDAMPHGGDLRLDLAYLPAGSPDVPPLTDKADNAWARITVRDSGTGISPADMPHIFEPFFTTKAPGQGSGLGLAQVYGIVKQHHGYIDVQTAEGEGTTFTIYLPALAATSAKPTAVSQTTLRQGQGETILVVEDNPTLRDALASTLTLLNYQALTAANGREALTILERQTAMEQKISLVLSDLVMPEMGGKELFQALRQRGLTLPVVILSGHPMRTEMQTLRDQGLVGWLLKPYDIKDLAATLARALGRDEPPPGVAQTTPGHSL